MKPHPTDGIPNADNYSVVDENTTSVIAIINVANNDVRRVSHNTDDGTKYCEREDNVPG